MAIRQLCPHVTSIVEWPNLAGGRVTFNFSVSGSSERHVRHAIDFRCSVTLESDACEHVLQRKVAAATQIAAWPISYRHTRTIYLTVKQDVRGHEKNTPLSLDNNARRLLAPGRLHKDVHALRIREGAHKHNLVLPEIAQFLQERKNDVQVRNITELGLHSLDGNPAEEIERILQIIGADLRHLRLYTKSMWSTESGVLDKSKVCEPSDMPSLVTAIKKHNPNISTFGLSLHVDGSESSTTDAHSFAPGRSASSWGRGTVDQMKIRIHQRTCTEQELSSGTLFGTFLFRLRLIFTFACLARSDCRLDFRFRMADPCCMAIICDTPKYRSAGVRVYREMRDGLAYVIRYVGHVFGRIAVLMM